MTSYRFFKLAAGSHVGFCFGNIRPSAKLQFLVPVCFTNFELIGYYSFKCIAICVFNVQLPKA